MKKGVVALLIVIALAVLVTPGIIGRLAEESIELGERHPRLIGFQTQIANIQEQVRDEVQAIVRNLDRRIASLRSQEEDLTTQIMVAEVEAAEAISLSGAIGAASARLLDSTATGGAGGAAPGATCIGGAAGPPGLDVDAPPGSFVV